MTTKTQGIDFLRGTLPPSKDVIFTTAEWLETVKEIAESDQFAGFVILRRYDDVASYGLHAIVRGHLGYSSVWSALVSPQGAMAFQNLLLQAEHTVTPWQEINLSDKHELFVGSILPVEWKAPSVWANEYLVDRFWLYTKKPLEERVFEPVRTQTVAEHDDRQPGGTWMLTEMMGGEE